MPVLTIILVVVVAWLHSYDIHIEFYMSQERESASTTSDQTDKFAHIHWIVIQCFSTQGVSKSGEGLAEYLAQFGHLQGITFETPDTTTERDPLVRMLTSIDARKVHQRTCEQAHKLALDAKKAGVSHDSPCLVSPFWRGKLFSWHRYDW